jgi:uncharacterized membrane protein YqiK
MDSTSALNFTVILLIGGMLLVALIAVGLIFARLYHRATKEVSFVRTGLGGQKVMINGGSIVLPVLHEYIPVNMNTLRLEVQRSNEQALITKDRMRVDVQAEFYVRVQPTSDSIANAAQTLGLKTMHPESLKELVEGKFVDALRAVAAEMSMEELHEQRVNFVQKVQAAVSEDLLKNGLELETVSLTGLDQTKREYFNPDNAFDAAGLTRLTDEIEERRRRRNEIEQDTVVAIETKNLEAERQKFHLAREMEYARLEQNREVETRRAAQISMVASEQAAKRREAEEAQIMADRQISLAKIEAERTVKEEQITTERKLRERDIEREKAIELANQDRDIAIAERSRAQSEAQALANEALAKAVMAEEQVITVRETEIAERQKAVELVEARKIADRDAIRITVAQKAEKDAALDQADAIRILAEAEAEKLRIGAEAETKAEVLRAEAAKIRYQVEAAGRLALNEADNVLTDDIVAMKVRIALIENLRDIIRESVRPLENIDGIKIIQVDGLTGGSSAAAGTNAGDGSGLADQVVASALRYRSQAPLIDSLMQEIGLSGSDLASLVKPLQAGAPPSSGPSSAEPPAAGGLA